MSPSTRTVEAPSSQAPSALLKKKSARRKRQERLAEKSIQKLLAWCKKREVTVEFGARESVQKNNKITLISYKTKHATLCYLLHEIGHWLSPCETSADDRGYARISDPDRSSSKPKLDKIHVLHEEIEAWERGLKLARKLNLYINKRRFDATRSVALLTYVKWVAELPSSSKKM